MSLTRRHYVLLAEALHGAKPDLVWDGYETRFNQWAHDVETVSRALSADNPHGFDQVQFLANCRQNDKERTA